MLKIMVQLLGLVVFVAVAAGFLAYRAHQADTSLESAKITVNA